MSTQEESGQTTTLTARPSSSRSFRRAFGFGAVGWLVVSSLAVAHNHTRRPGIIFGELLAPVLLRAVVAGNVGRVVRTRRTWPLVIAVFLFAWFVLRFLIVVTLRLQSWIGILVATVAKANFCQAVRSGKGIYLLGRQSDREASKLMFKYLYEIAFEVAPREAQAYTRTDQFLHDSLLTGQSGAALKRTFQSGWKLGYARALHKRLEAKRGQLLAGAREQGLIRIDRLERSLEEAIKLHFPSLRKSGGVRTKGVSGYQAGQKYGSEVGINSRKRLQA